MDDLVMSRLLGARQKALRAARTVTRCEHDAEDCVQTALQHAVEQGPAFAPENPAAWLVTVSRRRAVDLVRRKQAQANALLRSVADDICPDVAEDVADRAEARWLAMEARGRLPQSTQAVLGELVGGSSVRETATVLGLTERSVEGHLHRARGTLRRAWLSAAGVLAAVAGGLRRLAPVTAAPAVLVAVVLALHPSVSPAPSQGGSRDGGQTEPAVGSSWTAVSSVVTTVGAREQRPRSSATVAPPRPAGGKPVTPRPVVREQDPTGHTEATIKERGGTDDPVWGTVKCLQEFELTPSHVGC